MVERKDIIPILSNIGILIDEQMETFDVDLTEYILDSIQFISFIVELEREYNE